MAQRRKALDFIILSAIAFKQGKFKESATRLSLAAEQEDFDDTLNDLDALQEQSLETDDNVEEMSKALANAGKKRKKQKASDDSDADDSDADSDSEDEDEEEAGTDGPDAELDMDDLDIPGPNLEESALRRIKRAEANVRKFGKTSKTSKK